VHVKDIVLPDITIMNDPDLVIAKVSLRPQEVVEEVKPAEAVIAEGAEAAPAAEGAAETEAKGEAKTESRTGAAKAEAKVEKEKK